MSDVEKVTISRARYAELLDDQHTLNRLYDAGVDNWDGYGVALDDGDEEDDE